MGVCFGRKKNDRYSFQIQAQINNTVKEQEDIQFKESLEYKQQKQLDDDEITIKITQSQQVLQKDPNDSPSHSKNEIKESKHKKRKKKIKDENYLKQVEYNVSIKSIIIEEEQDQNQTQYNVTFVILYMEYIHNVNVKGVLINHPKKTFQIVPNTFEEAAKHARFNPFFSTDTYFNINQDAQNHTNYFEKLLHVERTVSTERQIRVQSTKKLSRRSSSVYDDFQSPSPKKRQNMKKNEFISELLEVVQIFDLETQPRFQQILFFLALKEQRPTLKANFVCIEELVILFERLPKFDQPNIYRLAIFYEQLDYNLHDLIVYMQHEQLQLSQICFLKLAHDLIQVFYICYQNYCYRINFTLSTIFYAKRSKKFKVQSFCRLSTLIPLEGDINLHLKNVSDTKLKFFVRAFRRDISALCDLLLYFKNINKPFEDIQQYRKFAKSENTEYIQYAEHVLDQDLEKNIFELIRFSLDDIEFKMINQFVDDIGDQVQSIEALIAELELKTEADKKTAKQPKPFTAYDKSLSESDDNINEIDNLDLALHMNSLPEFNKAQKVTELKSLYKEVLYSSLFLNYRFQQNCFSYLSNCADTLHTVHAQILQSLLQISYEEKEYEESLVRQIKFLQKSYDQAVAHPIDRQDPFHYYILIHLLAISEEKPFSLIVQLQRLMETQAKIKKDHVKPKLKHNHTFGGTIEMRKAVYLQLFFAENLIYRHNYSQALHCMQRIITWQQKQSLKATLQYCYCLFLNGQLCAKTMQPISAMLNLEMCKQLYDLYFPSSIHTIENSFPEQKTPNNQQQQQQQQQQQPQQPKAIDCYRDVDNVASSNQSTLEFKLGQMYFSLNDQENALKCLKRAKQIREKSFDTFSDQVVETTLEVLKIYVEQEESGSVAKLCCQQAILMNERYKEKFVFRTKQVAVLQLIMGVIYDNNGVLVSALKFYQRALKTFQTSKSSNYVRLLYITDKIKAIIARIKQVATQSVSLDKQASNELSNLKGFLSISDILKPFFSNSYYQNQKSNLILNPKVTSSIVYANGYLHNQELKEAQARYSASQNIYKKQRIDECYGIVLEKLGLIQIYQKQFEKGIQLMKLALEIHERYLQFPIKHKNILRINLYIMLFIASKNQQKQLLNQFDEIEKYIDRIYEEVHWNITPTAATNINKFRVMLTQIGPKALYEVMELIHLIDLYYSIKKLIYENMKQPEKLQELANLYATKKLLQLSQKQRQCWLDKRTKCQVGQLAKIFILKKQHQRQKTQNSVEVLKKNVEDPSKSGITQQTTMIEMSNEKITRFHNSMVEDSKDLGQSNNKILIDLRTMDEILEEQRRKQYEEAQKQRRFRLTRVFSQSNDQNFSNLQQSQNSSMCAQRQSQILQYSQMKQILENKQNISEFESQKSIKQPQSQQAIQQILQPVQHHGRQKKSTSQPATDQDKSKNSIIKISDEGFSNKRRRTISQQTNSSSKLQKFKINPFEKSQRKR